MNNIDYSQFQPGTVLFLVIVIAIAWTALWSGIALYRAGHDRAVGWFILLFVVHTLGILDIVYIFAVSLRRKRTDLVTRESLEARGLEVHERALTQKGE